MLLAEVSRVLAVDATALRDDTPLALLGWDSLARVCLVDLIVSDGAAQDDRPPDVMALDQALARAVTVGDLVTARETAGAGHGARTVPHER